MFSYREKKGNYIALVKITRQEPINDVIAQADEATNRKLIKMQIYLKNSYTTGVEVLIKANEMYY